MGLKTSKEIIIEENQLDLNKLQIDYLHLAKKNMRTLYLSIQHNPYNINIALKKKQFNKVTIIKSSLRSNSRKSSIHWKDYLLLYFKKQKEQGFLWYNDIIDNINHHVFLNENKFLSTMFYQGYEIDTKPGAIGKVNQEEAEEEEAEEEEVVGTNNNNNDGYLTNKLMINLSNNITGLSRIDLTKITDNLGGSFSSEINSNLSQIEDRYLVKKFIRLFKQHVLDDTHPINQVIHIFEKTLSYIIKEKIIELERLKNSDEEEGEYETILTDLCDEVVSHIQKFAIKTESALKLFYTEALNLQCFYEEKDELINIICGVLFKTGILYDKIYQLFSMQMSKEVFEFEQKITKQSKITPINLNINVKFRLDDSTKQYINYLIDKHKEKEKENKNEKDQDLSTNTNSNIPTNYNNDYSNVNYKMYVSKSNHMKKINNKFHKKNPINEYSTAIKIIRSVKYSNDPFEKMMLIASIGSEVISCVNDFWNEMDKYISSSFLTICPDDLVAIFIYIIIKADMPEILIHERIIREFTTSTTQLSIMGYYYTTLQGSLDYIRRNNLF